jgi:hypothetical protein
LRFKYENHKIAFRVGSLFTLAAFTSVSLDDKIAEDFGDRVLFNFTKVRGARIAALSQFPREAEILVPPPSVYRIAAVAKFHGTLVVTLECVDSPLEYLSPISISEKSSQRPISWGSKAAPKVVVHASSLEDVAGGIGLVVGGNSTQVSWGSKNAPKIFAESSCELSVASVGSPGTVTPKDSWGSKAAPKIFEKSS